MITLMFCKFLECEMPYQNSLMFMEKKSLQLKVPSVLCADVLKGEDKDLSTETRAQHKDK